MTTQYSALHKPGMDDLYTAWFAADKAWSTLIETTFPKEHPGDVRYTDRGKGEPGTALRAAYDEFCKTGSAWHEAKNADMPVFYI